MSSEREGERKIVRTGENLKSKDKEVRRKTKTVIPMCVAAEEIVTV
jgi:hypothetical protein